MLLPYEHLRVWLSRVLPAKLQEMPSTISLDLAGLLLLADLDTVARRTAQTGTSAYLDALILAPGLSKALTAPELSRGEYPACAAMTTGYVFRVENPATVLYLQTVGKTGHLTTVSVSKPDQESTMFQRITNKLHVFEEPVSSASPPYLATVGLTLEALGFLASVQDLWAVAVLALLVVARLINVIIIRQRTKPGWFGAPEPGVQSDLLVLLSQDRWIRIQGATDDVKAVTSGTWFSEPTSIQNALSIISTLLVYLDIVLVPNATQLGKFVLILVFLSSTALLSLTNALTKTSRMNGRTLQVTSVPKKYARRLDLAKELVKEFKRTDCFVGMGMIQPHEAAGFQEDAKESYNGGAIM